MSLNAYQGGMGAGKTCVAVNVEMARFLRESERPIATNLPCDGEELDCWLLDLSLSASKRAEYRQRIEFLPERGGRMAVPLTVDRRVDRRGEVLSINLVPMLDDDGEIVEADVLCEFWYFTKPNSVIFLDELADIYNAADRASRPETLASYINHHRHYKDDLYFFMQDKDDVDPQIRRKLQYVFDVKNSVMENIFGTAWWGLGLRWPVQFFSVHVFLGKQVSTRGGDLRRYLPQRKFTYWPAKNDFKHYRSFSESGKLAGKELASDTARNSNLETPWQRVKGWLDTAIGPASYVLAIGLAIWMGLRAVYWMANGMPSDKVASVLHGNKTNDTRTAAANAAGHTITFIGPVDPGSNGVDTVMGRRVDDVRGSNAAPALVVEAKERVRLVTPTAVVTNKRRFAVGDHVRGSVIERVLLNGVQLANGERIRFDDLLL